MGHLKSSFAHVCYILATADEEDTDGIRLPFRIERAWKSRGAEIKEREGRRQESKKKIGRGRRQNWDNTYIHSRQPTKRPAITFEKEQKSGLANRSKIKGK